jgi:hypothetical protein
VYSTPIFLNLAPILGMVKSSIPHEAWRFYFYFYFENLSTPPPSYPPFGFLLTQK